MSSTAAGELRHYVTLFAAGTPVPDGEGGYTETPVPLDPPDGWAAIAPATARDLERTTTNAVQSTATHLVRLRYHSGVTTQTIIRFGERTFAVTGVSNPDERNRETVCVCTEIVP